MRQWIGLGLAVLIAMPVNAEQEVMDEVGGIFQIMNRCYENENKVGVDLAKCILKVVDKTDNALGYKINITDDNPSKEIPSKFKIVIYNKYGLVATCSGIAEKTIEIKHCGEKQEAPLTSGEQLSITPPDMPVSKVTTEAKQSKMTPKDALKRLKDGNQRFLDNQLIKRDYLSQAKQSSYGQFPWAVVLNCMDSRSVPEFIFDQGLADLFTLRVAGNVLNKDNLGSLEFATLVSGTRLIVVMGHTACGAVAGACDGVELGHIDHILNKISPLVATAKAESGSDDCSNPELINLIAKKNALHVAAEIQAQSPIIRDLIAKKQVGIVAGIHDIQSGKVTFFEQGRLMPSN